MRESTGMFAQAFGTDNELRHHSTGFFTISFAQILCSSFSVHFARTQNQRKQTKASKERRQVSVEAGRYTTEAENEAGPVRPTGAFADSHEADSSLASSQ